MILLFSILLFQFNPTNSSITNIGDSSFYLIKGLFAYFQISLKQTFLGLITVLWIRIRILLDLDQSGKNYPKTKQNWLSTIKTEHKKESLLKTSLFLNSSSSSIIKISEKKVN